VSEPAPEPAVRGGTTGLAYLWVMLLAAAIFVGAVMGGASRHPGIGGLLGSLVGAAVSAGLFAAAGVFLIARYLAPALREEGHLIATYDGPLGEALAELERTRQEVKTQIIARAVKLMPLGAAAGVALWIAGQFGNDDPTGLIELAVFSSFGAAGGYFMASHKLGDAYRRMYKDRVLPQLAAQFDPGLTYREACPDLAPLSRYRLVDAFDDSTCEDEICGDYRGLPLSIVELRLTHGTGKEQRTVFDGLLTAVTLPRNLKGVTVVVPDRGRLGNWLGRLPDCEPVRIEDPVFEKVYAVYGTDQIAARALLTPAFMERFIAFASAKRFGLPTVLVQDNRLLIALPKEGGKDLFEPPGYLQPAAGRKGLEDLAADIAGVLSAADAVIDLDQAARAQAAPRP
jgi:hypothetical protein